MPIFGSSKTKWKTKTVAATQGPEMKMTVKISKTVSHEVTVPTYLTKGEKFKIRYRGDEECDVLHDDHVHEYIKERKRVHEHCGRLNQCFPPALLSMRFKDGNVLLSGKWEIETIHTIFEVVRGFYETAELCTHGPSLFNGLNSYLFIPGSTFLIRTHKSEKSQYRSVHLSPFEPVGLSIMNFLVSRAYTVQSTCVIQDETNVIVMKPASAIAEMKRRSIKWKATRPPIVSSDRERTKEAEDSSHASSVDSKTSPVPPVRKTFGTTSSSPPSPSEEKKKMPLKLSPPAVKPRPGSKKRVPNRRPGRALPKFKAREEKKLAKSLEEKARRLSGGTSPQAETKSVSETTDATDKILSRPAGRKKRRPQKKKKFGADEGGGSFTDAL